jgi:transcription-repair coupling factor (superfamily II helicase)
VAIRAAFKARYSKQVAILVPTTILAYQHYRTLQSVKRYAIGYLNVLEPPNKSRDSKRFSRRKLDIVIGTHQLINKTLFLKI